MTNFDAIETLLAEHIRHRRGSTAWKESWDQLIEVAQSDAQTASFFVEAALKSSAKLDFADVALSYVTLSDFERFVALSLGVLREQPKHPTAQCVIERASFQCLKFLHPHLDEIWALSLNDDSYTETFPWRESGTVHLAFLQEQLQATKQNSQRQKARLALLETRDPACLQLVISHGGAEGERLRNDLRMVGVEQRASDIEFLYKPASHHLIFPGDYFHDLHLPVWARPGQHPTWRLPTQGDELRFGGSGESACSCCAGTLHHLLTLDPVPKHLNASRKRLQLETCLSCLGWEQEVLFYEHDADGRPSALNSVEPPITPQFVSGPLQETRVRLALSGSRWSWQDWALSNGRENLHRLGGHPTWIQGADYLACPLCQRTMMFLLQLDSDMPLERNSEAQNEWMWGSGGIGYAFWCDACGVSGWQWQCT